MKKKCIIDGCEKNANYNIKHVPRKYCIDHKTDDMINLSHKICEDYNCLVRATYSVLGSPPKMCTKHKTNDMINVTAKHCKIDGCCVQPTFNLPNINSGLYCDKHKLEGMINVTSNRCEYNECNKTPSYNEEGLKHAKFCATHKEPGMIDIKKPTCEVEKCNVRPNYNIAGSLIPLRCSKHKLSNMIDIIHNYCEFLNCNVIPSFNIKGKKNGRFCVEHKLTDMVNVTSIKCKFLNCDKQSRYNLEKCKSPKFCLKHKTELMVDVLAKYHKKCNSIWCDTSANSKYDNYCSNCYFHLYPDNILSRNYKSKEKEVIKYIKENFINKTFIEDKRIQDGCSKRRPDLLLDLGYQVIIIEIDENQHIDYDCSCENKRLMELSQDVGHRPIIFIRFNPDHYFDINNKKIASCWSYSKIKKHINIDRKQVKEWNIRLNSLKEQITYWLNNKTEKTVEVIQLYFDQN